MGRGNAQCIGHRRRPDDRQCIRTDHRGKQLRRVQQRRARDGQHRHDHRQQHARYPGLAVFDQHDQYRQRLGHSRWRFAGHGHRHEAGVRRRRAVRQRQWHAQHAGIRRRGQHRAEQHADDRVRPDHVDQQSGWPIRDRSRWRQSAGAGHARCRRDHHRHGHSGPRCRRHPDGCHGQRARSVRRPYDPDQWQCHARQCDDRCADRLRTGRCPDNRRHRNIRQCGRQHADDGRSERRRARRDRHARPDQHRYQQRHGDSGIRRHADHRCGFGIDQRDRRTDAGQWRSANHRSECCDHVAAGSHHHEQRDCGNGRRWQWHRHRHAWRSHVQRPDRQQQPGWFHRRRHGYSHRRQWPVQHRFQRRHARRRCVRANARCHHRHLQCQLRVVHREQWRRASHRRRRA